MKIIRVKKAIFKNDDSQSHIVKEIDKLWDAVDKTVFRLEFEIKKLIDSNNESINQIKKIKPTDNYEIGYKENAIKQATAKNNILIKFKNEIM